MAWNVADDDDHGHRSLTRIGPPADHRPGGDRWHQSRRIPGAPALLVLQTLNNLAASRLMANRKADDARA